MTKDCISAPASDPKQSVTMIAVERAEVVAGAEFKVEVCKGVLFQRLCMYDAYQDLYSTYM